MKSDDHKYFAVVFNDSLKKIEAFLSKNGYRERNYPLKIGWHDGQKKAFTKSFSNNGKNRQLHVVLYGNENDYRVAVHEEPDELGDFLGHQKMFLKGLAKGAGISEKGIKKIPVLSSAEDANYSLGTKIFIEETRQSGLKYSVTAKGKELHDLAYRNIICVWPSGG